MYTMVRTMYTPYTSVYAQIEPWCPFHALAYEIECFSRAEEADSIIHPELGRGHSNYCEASHNVLVRFRSKDLQLHRPGPALANMGP